MPQGQVLPEATQPHINHHHTILKSTLEQHNTQRAVSGICESWSERQEMLKQHET
jgi:hypothetical protein